MPVNVPSLSGWDTFEAEKTQFGRGSLGTGHSWVGPFRDTYFIIPRARGGYAVWMGAAGTPWNRAKVRLDRSGQMSGRGAPQQFRTPEEARQAVQDYVGASVAAFSKSGTDLVKAWGEPVRTGAARGETYPKVYGSLDPKGVLIWTTVSVAWAGATPHDAMDRIQNAEKRVYDTAMKVWKSAGGQLFRAHRVEINVGKGPAILVVFYPLHPQHEWWPDQYEIISDAVRRETDGLGKPTWG